MNTNYSTASKKKWANIPQEERTRRMRELGKKRWQGKSKEEMRKHALMMVEIRRNKASG